jgi:hypothetical protein
MQARGSYPRMRTGHVGVAVAKLEEGADIFGDWRAAPRGRPTVHTGRRKLSEASFATVWNNAADAVYEELWVRLILPR